MPDLDVVTADGPLRVYTLLHDARPVLLNLGEPGGSTSRRGQIAFSWSTPTTTARGSFRRSARSIAPTAVLIRPTATRRGWEKERRAACPKR
jgi:hypothetical protein